jgi:hypothetical protein
MLRYGMESAITTLSALIARARNNLEVIINLHRSPDYGRSVLECYVVHVSRQLPVLTLKFVYGTSVFQWL